MKVLKWVIAVVALTSLPLSAAADDKGLAGVEMEEVASFKDQQVTGVAVSHTGRVFACFPFWSDEHTISVAELGEGGALKAYPDQAWNNKEGAPQQRFVCVQSVYIDDQDHLWILDPAAPKMEKVIKGGPKLIKVDLSQNSVVQTIHFEEAFAPEHSYLNDVRVDTKHQLAFITDSGQGALLIVDLKSGKARRVLADHPSTQAELGLDLVVDGVPLIDPKTGVAPAIHVDGLALDKDGANLFYHALTGRSLYRVKTSDLADATLSDRELGEAVHKVSDTPAPDGLLSDKHGRIYLAAFESNAILRFDPETKQLETIIADQRLQWPDSLAWGPDGMLYVTTSQIHRMPKFNGGVSTRREPYRIYRIKIP